MRIGRSKPLVERTEDRKGLIINRKKFHAKLLEVFEQYLADLDDPANVEMRKHFKKKMDYICHVSADF